MSKHTPGPWVENKPFKIWALRESSKARKGIVATVEIAWRDTEETQANARLIAAAPDLLEALKDGVDLEAGDLTGKEWKQAVYAWLRTARAAIAKAEGQTDG